MLMVRLLHLPRRCSCVSLPDCAIGSTPGPEPGGRSSSLRLAAIDPMRSNRFLHQNLVDHRMEQRSLRGSRIDHVIVVFNGSARQPAKLEVGVRLSPITPRVGGATG